jgi:DNA recombination protein RmuC
MEGLVIGVIILGVAVVATVVALLVVLLRRRTAADGTALGLIQARLGQVESQVRQSVEQGNRAQEARYADSLKVIGEIKQTVGGLEQTNRQMLDIGKDIQSLQDLLKPPKVRGGLGEMTLGQVLGQVLPRYGYEEQYRFKNGCIVDAVIRVGPKLVPVDSKFPLESFQRYMAAGEAEKAACLREFERSIKAKVEDIARKYILEDEATFDFALMYVPSENVYYQTIINDDLAIDGHCLSDFALEKKIVLVSPNSFYAYLSVICLGLRGLRWDKSTRTILDDCARVTAELDKFSREFAKMGGHLEHAAAVFSRSDQQLGVVRQRLARLGEPIREDRLPETGEEGSDTTRIN